MGYADQVIGASAVDYDVDKFITDYNGAGATDPWLYSDLGKHPAVRIQFHGPAPFATTGYPYTNNNNGIHEPVFQIYSSQVYTDYLEFWQSEESQLDPYYDAELTAQHAQNGLYNGPAYAFGLPTTKGLELWQDDGVALPVASRTVLGAEIKFVANPDLPGADPSAFSYFTRFATPHALSDCLGGAEGAVTGLVDEGADFATLTESDILYGLWIYRDGGSLAAKFIVSGAVTRQGAVTANTKLEVTAAGAFPIGEFDVRFSVANVEVNIGDVVTSYTRAQLPAQGVKFVSQYVLGAGLGSGTFYFHVPGVFACSPPAGKNPAQPSAFWTNFSKTFETI